MILSNRLLNLCARACRISLAPAALALAILSPRAAAAGPITIGQGPSIGSDSTGNQFYEEFQDWTHADLRALDATGALDAANGQYLVNDGNDNSRDLVAFYSRSEGANCYFRVDLNDLAVGAESGNLDLYIAIDTRSTTAPAAQFLPDNLDVQVDPAAYWELCVRLYDGTNRSLVLGDYSTVRPAGDFLGVYYNATLDAIEMGIKKDALYAAGWDGVSELRFTVGTAKDFFEVTSGGCGGGYYSDILDTFYDTGRGQDDCVINGYIPGNATVGRAKYASIAHANQSINKADDIRVHIYDTSVPQSEKTGFVRALDTHSIFKVPLNMHISGSLLVAAMWATAPTGGADKSDGPSWIQRCRDLADPNVTPVNPSSIIGGVFSEHIMPYFEGDVNRISMDLYEEVCTQMLGVGASQMRVMHVPERVIRSVNTGFNPLTGHTFADIAASTYTATYIDEVTHYHHWFETTNTVWSGFGGSGDNPQQHKIQRINGVYTFLINDREDRSKFGNDDGGLAGDTRYTLLNKAMQADQAQITVVFDDWEAMAGKSFNIDFGSPVPNNNMIQYQNSIRWIANKPWIEVVNLKDVLDRATNSGNPQYNPAWVVERGTRFDLPLETYEYLKWSSEYSYNNWYYNNNGGMGNEQDYYNLVPVLRGMQGDYKTRGLQTDIQGQSLANRNARANTLDANLGAVFLPSNKKLGDLNTSNSLLADAWVDIATAPDNALRRLGFYQYNSMIYETAWHEEQYPIGYDNTNYQSSWNIADGTWDGVNTWCLRLNNHARDVGFTAYAARWAEAVRTGAQTATTLATSLDLDQDGEVEYALRNNKVLAIFDRHGGRMLYAFHYHSGVGPISVIGTPTVNPSAPGEEEFTGTASNRCSALKDMNGGTYADAVYTAQVGTPNAQSIRFTSPDSLIQKTITLPNGFARLEVAYNETVSGDLYTRIGVSPNHMNLLKTGRTNLSTVTSAGRYYGVVNSAGGAVYVSTPAGVTRNASPSNAGFQNRNLALTEEIEVSGNGAFNFWIGFEVADVPVGLSALDLD